MNSRNSLKSNIIINVILCLFAIVTLIPFLYILSTSLLSTKTSLGNAVYILPVEFHLENFKTGWNYVNMGPAYVNSLFVAIVSGILHLSITIMAAFPLSRKNFPGRNLITFAFLGTLFIPSQVILIPTIILLKNIGLRGSLWGVILPSICDAFAIFVFVGFFKGIPRELEESAVIDGCSELMILRKIYIPLSFAPIATISLFHFLGVWNDIVLPALVLSGALEKLTLAPLLTMFLNTGGIPTKFIAATPNVKAAIIVMNIIPIFILYGFLQRFFREGITLGALKG